MQESRQKLGTAWAGAMARVTACAALAVLAACASTGTGDPSRPEMLIVVTQAHELVRVRAAQPDRVLSRQPLRGLAPGEEIRGIDFRVAYGRLYALGSSGRLYTVDTRSATLSPVGTQLFALPLQGSRFGFDFNPAADRLRIVSETGQNLRAHPVTGELVDADPALPGVQADGPLRYAPDDPQAGRTPQVTAAAYTYNQRDERLTTNFAIELATGQLVRQGSVEGQLPVVSPNTGLLRTVGPLGTGALADASFDIADVSNAALAALTPRTWFGNGSTQLAIIDLATGRARLLGRLADGTPVRGLAIEP